MRADVERQIHQTTDIEEFLWKGGYRVGSINPGKVVYIIHETGVSAYFDDFHIGEFRTETEAIRKVGELAAEFI